MISLLYFFTRANLFNEYLLGAHALGIRNLLCLTGDPVQAGDQLKARAVHDYESVRLLE